jgi:hypothetical protein
VVKPRTTGNRTCEVRRLGSTSPLSRARIMRAREEREVAWPADEVERWPLAKLIPYARNARTHSEDQIKQIAASIREWGWTVPVLIDEQGTLVCGHGRVLAAQLLGITDVPTMVARGWTHAQIQAYRWIMPRRTRALPALASACSRQRAPLSGPTGRFNEGFLLRRLHPGFGKPRDAGRIGSRCAPVNAV